MYIYNFMSERTLGAVAANPSWVTLTGAIDGVTGAIVGAAANPDTVLPKATTGTHCTQGVCVNHSCSSTWTFSHLLSITAISDIIRGITGLASGDRGC